MGLVPVMHLLGDGFLK